MNSPASLSSIEALSIFQAALPRFAREAEAALRAVASDTHAVVAEVEHAVRQARQRVDRCMDRVSHAESALDSCLNSGDPESGPPDCSSEEDRLSDARDELLQAEDRLNDLEDVQASFLNALDAYRAQALQLKLKLQSDIPIADAILNQKLATLEAYSRETPLATAGSMPSPLRALSIK